MTVTAATEFSARVTPGGLFAALPGTRAHGLAHLAEALARGAAVVLTDRPVIDCPVPVRAAGSAWEARFEFGSACRTLHGWSSSLTLLGVTGTNGKSTVCRLVRSILAAPGFGPAGACGTLGEDDGRDVRPATLTTPATEDLHAWAGRCAANGCREAALELSSHALDRDRAAGLSLAGAAVTNVTRDHLDYHGTHAALLAAKAKIADLLGRDDPLTLNADDPTGSARIGRDDGGPVLTFSAGGRPADYRATDVRCDATGSTFLLHGLTTDHFGPDNPRRVRLPLIGRFNVGNALAAAALTHASVSHRDHVVAGLEAATPVPGRLEPIDRGQPFRVLVDYAHTPDGLRTVLAAVRPLCEGRLRLVVGAGGDRDRGKRPAMGAAAGLADFTHFTSDNPRSENPAAILRALAAGHPDRAKYAIIEDRREAIAAALSACQPNDWLLVCGKGHETTQEVAGQFRPFDDRAVCRELLGELGYGG